MIMDTMLQLIIARKRSPVGKDNEEITELLLSKGANVDARGRHGTTSLCIAAERGYLEIVKHLIKYGADVNSAYTSTTPHSYTQLHLKNDSQEIIKKILSKGANVNAEAEDLRSKTCLRIALQGREFQIAEHLLKHAADVNPAYASIPLRLAVEKADEQITELLF